MTKPIRRKPRKPRKGVKQVLINRDAISSTITCNVPVTIPKAPWEREARK